MPRISVIIPCYNQGAFLRQSVQSVLDQNISDVEVVVVDDGSTDQTPDVARSFGSRIRYLRQQNSGPSAARNAGIALASAEFLAFLDADDSFEREVLQARLEALDADPQAAVCLGAWAEVDSTGTHVLRTHEAPNLRQDPFHVLLRANVSPPLCFLIRRSAVVELGMFRTDERGTEDWDLWLRVAAAGYRFVVTGPGANRRALYRLHGTSLSKNFRLMHHSAMRVLKMYEHSVHPRCAQCRSCAGINRSELRRLYAATWMHRLSSPHPGSWRQSGLARCKSLFETATDVVAEPALFPALVRVAYERLRERLSSRQRLAGSSTNH